MSSAEACASPSDDTSSSSAEKPANDAAAKKKERTPSELLAAVAVAGIAFWAPTEETGLVLRALGAVSALIVLLFAEVGLEALLKVRSTAKAPKKNAFEVVTKRCDVPTAPPGGIFEAACAMAKHLNNFPVDIKSRVTSTESGFQILSGNERLRVKVLAGNAIGWEHGSPLWFAKRDEWIKAVQAAPRCSQVMSTEWMGVTSLSPSDPPPPPPPLEAGS